MIIIVILLLVNNILKSNKIINKINKLNIILLKDIKSIIIY